MPTKKLRRLAAAAAVLSAFVTLSISPPADAGLVELAEPVGVSR